MTKQELRQYAKTKRKEIVNKQEKDFQITKNILNNPLVLKSKNILVYLSTPFEVDTFELISKLKNIVDSIIIYQNKEYKTIYGKGFINDKN